MDETIKALRADKRLLERLHTEATSAKHNALFERDALRAKDEQWQKWKYEMLEIETVLRAKLQVFAALVKEFTECPVEFDDGRLDYISVQIPRSLMKESCAAIKQPEGE